MSFEDDEFEEDINFILSDDESAKKPRKNVNIEMKTSPVSNDIFSENGKDEFDENLSQKLKTNKVSKSNLFEDEIDPLAMIDEPKIRSRNFQESKNKGAASVLDSLLNPVSDLDDFSFKRPITNTKEINDDEFWKASKYRPSTGLPQVKNAAENPPSKRSVRFSTDAIGDIEPETTDNGRGRPVTAPSTSGEVAKSKFVSRFEEAEFSDVLPKHNSTKINSESDPSLWRATPSDDFYGSSGSGTKSRKNADQIELMNNNNGKSRINANQKLSEFLQNSSDDLLTGIVKKAPQSSADQSSNEDINFPAQTPKLDKSLSNRRTSVQADSMLDRPKTGYGRSEAATLGTRRRASVHVDSSFESLTNGRSDVLDLEYSRNEPTFSEKPRSGHGRHENYQNRPGSSRSDLSDVELQLKQAQSEKEDLLYKLEGLTKRNKEEIDIIDKSYKNRLESMEDNMQRKEKRFKEEIEMLSQTNKQRLQMLEDERMEMRSELSRRQDDIENQKRNEIMRIKEQHKLEVDKLKNNYDDMLEKLRHAKYEEDSTIRLAQPTTVQLQSVLTQVSNGAQDLASLKQQLVDQMNLQIKEKDNELKLKNDSLRLLEEQLHAQKDENYRERERLQSLISKLDIQLKEQSKQADEERWYLRQEQNKLAALQSSLEKEREHILMEKDHNRASHEEFRSKLLEEQKQLFDKLYDEQRSLAEERAKLTREVAKWSETSQFTNVKKNQESAEVEGIRSALAEERREIESMKSQLVKEREENIQKHSQINSLSYDLKLKSEKLHQLEMELSEKQRIIDEKETNCRQLEMKGTDALKKASSIQSSYQEQLSNIQRQLVSLAEKEKQIHKEQIALEKNRSNLIKQDKSFTCMKCSNIFQDSAIGGSLNNINSSSRHGLTKAAGNRKYDSYLDYDVTNSIEYTHQVVGKMEEERLINSIRRAADEDRDYLENERAYLRSLSRMPDQYIRNQLRS